MTKGTKTADQIAIAFAAVSTNTVLKSDPKELAAELTLAVKQSQTSKKYLENAAETNMIAAVVLSNLYESKCISAIEKLRELKKTAPENQKLTGPIAEAKTSFTSQEKLLQTMRKKFKVRDFSQEGNQHTLFDLTAALYANNKLLKDKMQHVDILLSKKGGNMPKFGFGEEICVLGAERAVRAQHMLDVFGKEAADESIAWFNAFTISLISEFAKPTINIRK
jgi:hypothetical protein